MDLVELRRHVEDACDLDFSYNARTRSVRINRRIKDGGNAFTARYFKDMMDAFAAASDMALIRDKRREQDRPTNRVKFDRQITMRVYRDGKIVVSIFAPYLHLRLSSATFTTGWPRVLTLLDRCTKDWAGLTYDIHIRYQGMPVFERPRTALPCDHDWQEQPGEPPYDVCSSCGEVRR